MTLHPTVLWAQRADHIYLTVELVDIKDPVIELTADHFRFKGKGGTEQKEYECEIKFFKPVDPKKSHKVLTSRELTFTIIKTEAGYWDRLYQGPKPNFIKVDFSRWKDEDDDEDEQQQQEPAGPSAGGMPDMASLASMMGGGAGGPGGAGGMPDFASMMGGAGGPGGGMPDMASLASMMGGSGAGGMPDFSQDENADQEQDENETDKK